LIHEYLEVGVEAGRDDIIPPLLLCPLDCPLKWRLEADMIPEYLEVSAEAGRGCIIFPLLLCPLKQV
jgi:hypothetical protein